LTEKKRKNQTKTTSGRRGQGKKATKKDSGDAPRKKTKTVEKTSPRPPVGRPEGAAGKIFSIKGATADESGEIAVVP
jgi:hypothetical protein